MKRKESPEIDLHVSGYLIYDKGDTVKSKKRMIFSVHIKLGRLGVFL